MVEGFITFQCGRGKELQAKKGSSGTKAHEGGKECPFSESASLRAKKKGFPEMRDKDGSRHMVVDKSTVIPVGRKKSCEGGGIKNKIFLDY